jgi:dihydropteroate synthase
MVLRARETEISFPRPGMIMGIVNVTPDSFTDGGKFFDAQQALEHARGLIEAGAEIIDIGGESTRPRSSPVSEEEELRRVLPVIREAASWKSALISVDTQKPAVAREAVLSGAAIINDIGANRAGDEMFAVAAETGAGYVIMHMQGTPQTMQLEPRYEDVVKAVSDFFGERMARAVQCGVRPEQIILDPGIGFGKTVGHNLQLLAGVVQFRVHHRPLLLGASRKSFISKLLGGTVAERLGPSLACALWAIAEGVEMVRVHDVLETVRAVRMAEAIRSKRQ